MGSPAQLEISTLEMRLTDICTNIEDAITIACVYRCWMRLLHRLKLQNQRWREYSTFLVQENRWRAQRYGIDRGLIDFGRREMVDFPDLAEEIIEITSEDAEYFDCVEEVQNIRNIIERGTSAHQQLSVYNQSINEGRSNELALVDVVKFIVKETLVGVAN